MILFIQATTGENIQGGVNTCYRHCVSSRKVESEITDLVFHLKGLLEERALLLGRMGKHEQALFIYVHILKDTRMAEE